MEIKGIPRTPPRLTVLGVAFATFALAVGGAFGGEGTREMGSTTSDMGSVLDVDVVQRADVLEAHPQAEEDGAQSVC